MTIEIKVPPDTPVNVIDQTEEKVFQWCTQKLKFTRSATALAKLYASCAYDAAYYFSFHDLRCLDDTRLDWAVSMMTAAATGWRPPHTRARELIEMYRLQPLERSEATYARTVS